MNSGRFRSSSLLVLAAAAVVGVAVWRSCRREEPHVSKPPPARVPDAAPEERAVLTGVRPVDRSKLRDWIARLGRAVAVKDRRTYAELKASPPAIYESDVPWIYSLLKEELFTAAGAAEILAWFAPAGAAEELAAMLRGSAHVAAKDVAVSSLASLGATAALLDVLRSNPEGSIRARAATALAGSEAARQALLDALHDSDPNVRRAAADALREASVDVLLATIPNEPDAEIAAELAVTAYRSDPKSLPRIYELLDRRPDVRKTLQERLKLGDDSRYAAAYEPSFFRDGGAVIAPDARQRRIGITVQGRLEDARLLFSRAPLDRYREYFYFRIESEFADDLASGAAPRAYDAEGRPIVAPANDLDGHVHLRFRDPKEFARGILGFTEGRESFVTEVSLLHEFGHALARLADEYDHPLASNLGEANVDRPGRDPKWSPLIRQGHLGPAVPRGTRVIPSSSCFMNNRPADDRWCPVCQLELISAICALTGAPAPW